MTRVAIQTPAIGSGVTDVSSNGLIPQLTGLLHALTDSHELLLGKLRAVRREHDGAGRLVIDRPVHSESLALVDARPPALVEPKTEKTNGQHGIFLIGRTALRKEPDWLALDEPKVGPDVAAQHVRLAHPTKPAPSGATSQIVTPRPDMDAGLPAQAANPSPALEPDPSDAGSAHRSYNFFDELDARLIHLRDPASGAGDDGFF